jgi:hypothetical protein
MPSAAMLDGVNSPDVVCTTGSKLAVSCLHPDAPMARYDQMGLIWMLKGERVVALTATEARLSG